jgi:hypothetical protein
VRVALGPPDTPVPLRFYMVGASHPPAIPFLPHFPPHTAQVARPRGRNQPMTHFRAVIHRATDPCGAPAVSRAGHRASKIRGIRRLDPGQ